jgi:hypothetical protein
MPLPLLTSITEQLPASTVIVPFYRGEPTLHPHFSEAMQKLSKFETVQFATNGDFLTRDNQKAILGACTFLSLSLHSCLRPEYSGWLSFLYECGGKGIETQVSILDSLVRKHKREFVKDWLRHVDRVRIYQTHSQDGFGSMGEVVNEKCLKPFEEMVVYWDGRVGLCNHDWNMGFPLGNLNEQTVAEVFNGSNYAGVRDLHESGLRRAVPTCEFCSFKSNKRYGELIRNGG